MNNFKVLLQAVLDSNGIGGNDITKIQKIIDKYHINLTTQLDTASMMAEIKKIVPQLESELSKIYNADIKISDKELLKAINQIGNEAEKTASKVKTIAESLNNGTYSLQIDQLKSQFQKFGLSADEAENRVKELRTTLSNMKSSSGNELVTNFQKWQNQIKGVKIQLDQAKLSFDKFEQPVSDEKITSLLLRIQNFLSKNTAINFHWISLTICDGIFFKMSCDKDITIKDYLVFDDKMCYDIEVNDNKNIIKIISTNWLNSYSGFTITASDT